MRAALVGASALPTSDTVPPSRCKEHSVLMTPDGFAF